MSWEPRVVVVVVVRGKKRKRTKSDVKGMVVGLGTGSQPWVVSHANTHTRARVELSLLFPLLFLFLERVGPDEDSLLLLARMKGTKSRAGRPRG